MDRRTLTRGSADTALQWAARSWAMEEAGCAWLVVGSLVAHGKIGVRVALCTSHGSRSPVMAWGTR
jgi:hypothetical protein